MKPASERIYRSVIRKEVPAIIQSAETTADERRACPYAVMFALPYRADARGLPDNSELDRVVAIEEKLMQQLQAVGHIHVGHVTAKGQMLVIFYCRAPINDPITVKTGLLSKATVTPDCRRDDHWSVFEEHLKISSMEVHLARNFALLSELKRHGDIHTTPRPVDFFAVFPSETARASFIAEISNRGYSYSADKMGTAPDGTAVIEFVKHTPVEDSVISAICAELDEFARQAGGEFDGWACPVMR